MIKYERRRLELVLFFEAVRHAQQVQVNEIPLPPTGNDMGRGFSGALTAQIPLPDMPQPPIHTYPIHPHYLPQHHPQISSVSVMPTDRDPPGVPPYLPPDLSDDEDDNRPPPPPLHIRTRLPPGNFFCINDVIVVKFSVIYIYIYNSVNFSYLFL